MRPSTPKSRRDQRGAVLVWIALFLMVMLMFVALGVDAAKLMVTRSQLQNAADAAALAGASAIDPATGLFIEPTVRAQAAATASSNRAFENTATSVIIDPQNDVTIDQANRTVTVVTRRDSASGTPMIVHFAQVLGITTLQMRASATAKVDYANSVCRGLVPLAMAPADSSDIFMTGCANEYTLKYGAGSGEDGWYRAVRFPSCDNGACSGMSPSGGSTFRCLLGQGYACCIDFDQCLTPEPGNMSGPTAQGLQARFLSDTDQRDGICYSEVSPSGQEPYHGNGARVVYVPLTTAASGGGASGCVYVKGFAAFFIKQRPGTGGGSVIIAEFIEKVLPGEGQGSPGSTVFALRLVR